MAVATGDITDNTPTVERRAQVSQFGALARREQWRYLLLLAPGVVFRFALAGNLALFFAMTPAGDQAILVDADPASATFGQTLTTIPLASLSNGPQAGESPWEAESRIAALTPDGATGFISHGGDGVISVIDTQAGVVSQQLAVPTSLAGGGYMIAVNEGVPFVDTVAR